MPISFPRPRAWKGNDMNKKYIVRLTQPEREQLEDLVNKGKTAAHKIKHAHILLQADADGSKWADENIAQSFRCHNNTVRNIREAFVLKGLEAALERKPRKDPPRSSILDGQKEARLIALSCGKPPEGFGSWSLRLLADKMVELEIVERISYETVRLGLKKTRSSRI